MLESLTFITKAMSLAKSLKQSSDAMGNAEVKMQIAELMSALADAKVESVDANRHIADLEAQLKTKSEMRWNGKAYNRVTDDGDKEGAYCPTCFDDRSKEIRLQTLDFQECDGDYKKCNVCNFMCS